MSGGHFDYAQYRIDEISDQIKRIIEDNEYECHFNEETSKRFKEAIIYLNIAFVYAHRIDWLISGDDGEDTFHERLKDELAPLLKALKGQEKRDDQA